MGSGWAQPAALIENVLYLAAAFRFILMTPLDLAAGLEDPGAVERMASFQAFLPGALFSAAYVVVGLKLELARLSRRHPS